MIYHFYNPATGVIFCTADFESAPDQHDCPPPFAAIAAPPNTTAATHYITGSPLAVTPRPAMSASLNKTTITANGTDSATLSGIPSNAIAVVSDGNGAETLAIADGALVITAVTAQTITVRLVAFPYLDAVYTVTAT